MFIGAQGFCRRGDFLAVQVTASAIPSRPSPARLVNDLADLFSRDEEARLERALVAFDDSTSNQIAVVTVTDLEGTILQNTPHASVSTGRSAPNVSITV